jgi:hypothetical protein
MTMDFNAMQAEKETFLTLPLATQVASLAREVSREFGSRIELDLVDPRNMFFLLDVLRYGVKPTEPVWILDGKIAFRGIPEWKDLKAAIEESLGRKGKD